jgi:hypothetical protein
MADCLAIVGRFRGGESSWLGLVNGKMFGVIFQMRLFCSLSSEAPVLLHDRLFLRHSQDFEDSVASFGIGSISVILRATQIRQDSSIAYLSYETKVKE